MPIIAGAAVNVAIRRTYDAAISPIAAVFGTRDLPDFRPQQVALLDWTTLKGRHGDRARRISLELHFQFGRDDSACLTIGGITGVSRQLWINGAAALGNLSQAQGRRLAADVSDRMVAYVTQNGGGGPAMKEGGVCVQHRAGRARQCARS